MSDWLSSVEAVTSRGKVSPQRKIFNINHIYGLTGDLKALWSNPFIILYNCWKHKVSQAVMCYEREIWNELYALYPSMIYYVQSGEDISI